MSCGVGISVVSVREVVLIPHLVATTLARTKVVATAFSWCRFEIVGIGYIVSIGGVVCIAEVSFIFGIIGIFGSIAVSYTHLTLPTIRSV